MAHLMLNKSKHTKGLTRRSKTNWWFYSNLYSNNLLSADYWSWKRRPSQKEREIWPVMSMPQRIILFMMQILQLKTVN